MRTAWTLSIVVLVALFAGCQSLSPLAVKQANVNDVTLKYVDQGQGHVVRSERLHEEVRRRVKMQGTLPGEDAALTLVFGLVASGQIKLRRIDGWKKIAAVLNQNSVAA